MDVLRLLGGASLVGNAANAPVQRHQLALLALLATAPSARGSRDKIIALLWPESPPSMARHSLNVALHGLRKALGEGVIRSVGADLQLDFTVLPCDVARFSEHVTAGDRAGAVALYGGPFMDGFYLDGAEEFERWQESERARLRAAYAESLEALAAEAERSPDPLGAVSWWRRLSLIDPGSTRITLRLMGALEQSGDRAGALAVAEGHGDLMARDFDAEPSPEVVALATRIRERPVLFREGEGPAGHVLQVRAAVTAEAAGELPHPQIRPPQAVAWRRLSLWTGAVAVVPVVALVLTSSARRGQTASTALRPTAVSIAVLPFQNMSANRDNQYLSDGLTEELLNALTRVRGLRVAARTSSFQFRDRTGDVREIGRRLDVSAVVEGSVRASGDSLRITAQLIDTRTGYHLWSDEFDRPAADVFAVQEDIARAVTRALRVQLAQRIGETLVSAGTQNAEAHDLYLRGRFEWNKRTEEGMRNARDAFERAVVLDPRYAAAYAGLSDTWQLLAIYGQVATREALANAKTAALRALALDSTLAEAHTSLAVMHLEYDHDREAAERRYRRAIEISPGYATAHHWYALFLVAGGRFQEAIAEAELARRLDPLSRVINAAVGTVHLFSREYAAAIAEFRAILVTDPDWSSGLGMLGRTLAAAGQFDEAVARIQEALELSGRPSHKALLAYTLAAAGRGAEARALLRELVAPGRGVIIPPVDLAAVHVALGQHDEAIAVLNRGVEERDEEMMYLKVDPRYDPIRGDPRFAHVLAALDLDGTN
jgi:serine/threonine-protein kinase